MNASPQKTDDIPVGNIPVVGFDTETDRFGPCNLIPKLVCVQVSSGEIRQVASTGDGKEIDNILDFLFPGEDAQPRCRIVGHTLAYDLASSCGYRPDLISKVFLAFDRGVCHCISIREKLLNLSTHGQLDTMVLPDGSGGLKLRYSLADLVQKYLGLDISEGKVKTVEGKVVEGDETAWRVNYIALDGKPVSEWPQDAIKYALDDAVYAEMIFHAQEERRQEIIAERGFDPFKVEPFRVAVDFCLYLMSAWGMATDLQEIERVEAMLMEELAPERMQRLIGAGILRPGEPPRPFANGARNHLPTCTDKKRCNCPPKMTRAISETINKAKLCEYMEAFARDKGIALRRTPPSDKFPQGQVETRMEWFEEHAHLDPLFAEYVRRAKLQKLVTTEIPRMKWQGKPASVVHPCYDVLKATGRTSSFASEAYPSFNCQNVDPRARNCYVARPGTLLVSVDYSQMELVTLAQTCYRQFGYSILGDKINAGVDPHAFLGSQICFRLHAEFHQACRDEAAANGKMCDPDWVYECFIQMKNCGIQGPEKLYKHFRTFAKPTGLGYPGGLGPATFITYAKDQFGVEVDLDTARELRDVWLETYPEMVDYFQWINNELVDPWNPPQTYIDKETGEERQIKKYAYQTPMGMWRTGCDYCAAANGVGLQSPSAEGALLALYNVVRGCYDPSLASILYGQFRPICFIHDELIGELSVPHGDPTDDMTQERLREISRIMVEAFREITPDVAVKAQPVLMERWDKNAEPVFDDKGRLIVWKPNNNNN